MTTRADFLAKHAAYITRDPIFGCWIFADPTRKSGGLDRDGYGVIWGKDGPRSAHSVAWREIVGTPVPAGHVLDHWCRRRACCRPEHLEIVTGAENDRRRNPRYRARFLTKCPRGHSLALCIVSIDNGKICRECMGPEVIVRTADDPPIEIETEWIAVPDIRSVRR